MLVMCACLRACVLEWLPACSQRPCAYLCVREGMPAYLLGLLPPARARLHVGACCVCARVGAPVPLRERPLMHALGQKRRALVGLQARACFREHMR